MIYFIQDTESRSIKIGISKNPQIRLSALQIAHHSLLVLLAVMDGDEQDEQALHCMFTRKRGEWFAPTRDLLTFIHENAIAIPQAKPAPSHRPHVNGQWRNELQGDDYIVSMARLMSRGQVRWNDNELSTAQNIIWGRYKNASESHPDIFPPMSQSEFWDEVQRLVNIQNG